MTADTPPPTPGEGQSPASGSGSSAMAASGTTSTGNWFVRHKWWTAAVSLLLVLALGAGGWLYYLNGLIEPQSFAGPSQTLNDESRPRIAVDSVGGSGEPVDDGRQSLNILLGGADNGDNDGDNVDTGEALAAPEWENGKLRSDTIMIMHIPAGRQQAYLISIPRDSYVTIYDEQGKPRGEDKINAAFSRYGPTGYISTIEHLTDLRMDHLAIVDWTGFKDISTALGGVEVFIPEAINDDSQGVTWERGYETLEGSRALAYVRTRYGLENGDFDRIARQQNFMRAMMEKMLDQGVFSDPITFAKMLQAVVDNLYVDDGFTPDKIRDLTLSLRGLESDDVVFVTAPLGRYSETDSGSSIVLLAKKQTSALWDAVREEKLRRYVRRFGDESGALKDPKKVN